MPVIELTPENVKDYGTRNFGKTNPFAGTPYETLWENNPYKSLYYEPTFWDNIGLSSKAKDTNAHYKQLYDEYVAGLYDQQRQDEYNSPSNQAKLQREAGLNPDLNGVSSFESGLMSPPQGGLSPAQDGQSPAFDGFSMLTNVLGFATSAFGSISGLMNTIASTDSTRIDNFSKLSHIAEEVIKDSRISNYLYGSGVEMPRLQESSSWFVPKKLQKQYKDAFDFALQFPERNTNYLYDALNNREQNRWDYGSKVGYSNYDQNDKALFGYIGKIVDLQHKLNRSNMTSQIRENIVNDFKREVNGYLYHSYKQGSVLAGLMLIGNNSPQSSIFLNGSNFANKLSKGTIPLKPEDVFNPNAGQQIVQNIFDSL